jgi:hypothetical protein
LARVGFALAGARSSGRYGRFPVPLHAAHMICPVLRQPTHACTGAGLPGTFDALRSTPAPSHVLHVTLPLPLHFVHAPPLAIPQV